MIDITIFSAMYIDTTMERAGSIQHARARIIKVSYITTKVPAI